MILLDRSNMVGKLAFFLVLLHSLLNLALQTVVLALLKVKLKDLGEK